MEKSDIHVKKVLACVVFDKNYWQREYNQQLYVADYYLNNDLIADEIDDCGGWEYFLEECNRHGYEFFSFLDERGNAKYATYLSDSVISNGEYGEHNRKILEQLGEI